VEASSDSSWITQKSEDYALKELKKQAAKLGANGILLTAKKERITSLTFGITENDMVFIKPSTAKTAKGKAIFVIEE
jgi:uncharacterized protein YbjQ (UPF0145 family)